MHFPCTRSSRRGLILHLLFLLLAGFAAAKPPPPPQEVASAENGNLKTAFFEQPISHFNRSLGTFKQRYAYSGKYYAGPGSPIVIFTPGEDKINPYISSGLVNMALYNAFAKAIGGGLVVIEHRYFGESSPYQSLSTKNLQQLTVQEALEDFAYFAREVKLPFDPKGTSRAGQAPWIFTGCSYSGALSAWMQSTGIGNGTFWAYHSSSGVVHAVKHYYEYFSIIEHVSMPSTCRQYIELAISYIDRTLINGTPSEQHNLKAMFSLEELRNDDFAWALRNYVEWQYGPDYQFCKALKKGLTDASTTSSMAAPNATAQRIVSNWAGVVRPMAKHHTAPYFNCVPCLKSHNASDPRFSNLSPQSHFATNRLYKWLQCNQFGLFLSAKPGPGPSIISKLITEEYETRQCGLYFPPEGQYTYGGPHSVPEKHLDAYTGGWTRPAQQRIVYVNFEYDPYRDATVSARDRPGGPLKSSASAPIHVVPKHYHCGDLFIARKPGPLRDAQQATIAQIKSWTAEYYKRQS